MEQTHPLAWRLPYALLIMLVSSVVGTATSAQAGTQTASDGAQCKAAAAVVAEVLKAKHPVALARDPPVFPTPNYKRAELLNGWSGIAAPEQLIDHLYTSKLRPALACRGVREAAQSVGLTIVSVSDARSRISATTTEVVGQPFLARDGQGALAFAQSINGNAGTERLHYLRRSGTTWRIVGTKGLAIY